MLNLAAYLHTLDPFLIDFGGGVGVRWYGLSYLVGFYIGYLLVKRVTRVGISSLQPERVADLIITLALGIVIGGRLGYVLFYRIDLLWTMSPSFPWWSALAINEGGMASHGGMIGGILASGWYAWRHHHKWNHLLDLFAFGAPLGLFFGRIANFINGELLGRPCDPALAWAVKFPQEMTQWTHEQIERLYAAYADAGTVPLGEPERIVAHTIRAVQDDDARIIALVEPLLTARHPSQLYAAVGEGLVVFLVLLWAWRKPQKPYLVGSLFCVTYALMRIVDEFFRMPDEHIAHREFALLGVTRGQWLSAGLLALGVLGLVLWRRSRSEVMGGWRRREA